MTRSLRLTSFLALSPVLVSCALSHVTPEMAEQNAKVAELRNLILTGTNPIEVTGASAAAIVGTVVIPRDGSSGPSVSSAPIGGVARTSASRVGTVASGPLIGGAAIVPCVDPTVVTSVLPAPNSPVQTVQVRVLDPGAASSAASAAANGGQATGSANVAEAGSGSDPRVLVMPAGDPNAVKYATAAFSGQVAGNTVVLGFCPLITGGTTVVSYSAVSVASYSVSCEQSRTVGGGSVVVAPGPSPTPGRETDVTASTRPPSDPRPARDFLNGVLGVSTADDQAYHPDGTLCSCGQAGVENANIPYQNLKDDRLVCFDRNCANRRPFCLIENGVSHCYDNPNPAAVAQACGAGDSHGAVGVGFAAYLCNKCTFFLVESHAQRDLGCVIQGTRVSLPNQRTKAVEELRAGDQVWSPLRKVAVRVKEVTSGLQSNGMRRIVAGDHSVTVNPEHPMWTERGLVPAVAVKVGDVMHDEKGGRHPITAIEDGQRGAPAKVFNLILDAPASDREAHLFVTDGLVTGDMVLQRQLQPRTP